MRQYEFSACWLQVLFEKQLKTRDDITARSILAKLNFGVRQSLILNTNHLLRNIVLHGGIQQQLASLPEGTQQCEVEHRK